jgi:hypothetical protein
MSTEELEAQVSELKKEIAGCKSAVEDIYAAINRLAGRISDIENNGIKTAVGDLREDVNAQRLKINKLDRARRGLA